MVVRNFSLESAWPHDALKEVSPQKQKNRSLLYCLCLMEYSSASPAWASTERSFGNGARSIMQIQCHNHPMQASYACGCGHTFSSGVGRNDTRVYFHIDLLFTFLTWGLLVGIRCREANRRSKEMSVLRTWLLESAVGKNEYYCSNAEF